MVLHFAALLTLHSLRPAVLAGLATLLGFRIFREVCFKALYASRLFFFRLGHIAFHNDPIPNDARLDRALQLICRTIAIRSRQEIPEIPIETIQTISMLAL